MFKRKKQFAPVTSVYMSLDGEAQRNDTETKLRQLNQLLDDLLLIDPTLDRFREDYYTFWGQITARRWAFESIREAAELLSSDAADAEKRARVAEFIHPKSASKK